MLRIVQRVSIGLWFLVFAGTNYVASQFVYSHGQTESPRHLSVALCGASSRYTCSSSDSNLFHNSENGRAGCLRLWGADNGEQMVTTPRQIG